MQPAHLDKTKRLSPSSAGYHPLFQKIKKKWALFKNKRLISLGIQTDPSAALSQAAPAAHISDRNRDGHSEDDTDEEPCGTEREDTTILTLSFLESLLT